MKRRSTGDSRRSLLLTLFVLGIATAVVILPTQFRSSATSRTGGEGLFTRTTTHDDEFPNYDIRSDKGAIEKIASFRDSLSRSAVDVANIRDEFTAGEAALKSRVPTLKVEYNEDIRIPEVIAPDVKQGAAMLTGSSSNKRSAVLKNFLKENTSLVGVASSAIDGLKVTSDYTNPDGNLSFALLEQEFNGIPVFRGEVKAGFTKRGEMIRVINNLAPGIDAGSLSTDFGDPADAVRAAAGYIKHDLTAADRSPNSAESNNLKSVFGSGDWATTAEKMYFPTEPGVAVPAWRVLIWGPVNTYYVIVDARSGTMLWRKNIGEDQTQAATYNVYTNLNAMINSADSPAPMTPGPVDPTLGTQAPVIARTNVTRVGNEAPYTFNNNGWITDGANITDGNAVEAGIDRDGTNGVDAAQSGNPSRIFTTGTAGDPGAPNAWNPPPGNPGPGDAPLDLQAQRGAVVQMFYVMNLYHDELYRLGFTEQAFNFQHDNFGRGGVANDRVSAEGQDSSGTNNANFSTPADGGRGRMQMYIWTGPTPDKDGTADADIIIHEVTHGTSNRLHGNSAGLSTNMSRGMGEGWGDFYGHAMLSEPTDPINGIYTTGGYATHLGSAGFTGNYYYGIRRFPKAVMAFTGGPSNRPHNPLTFADVDSTQFNISDGAFSRGPFGSATIDQVHNLGEIWSTTLWEVRAKLVTRLGWATGNRKALQFVTDGMKLSPLGPTFLQERDAILAAAAASALAPEAAADVADVWAGFAIRGMGFSAVVNTPGTGGNNTRVTEAFDLPNLVQTPTFTLSDAAGDNDGFPEPGELLSLSIPLTNSTGGSASGVTLQVVGGGSANYGTIAHGQTVTQAASFTVPIQTACGSALTLTFNVNSSLGATSFTRTIIIGQPITTFTENFDGVTAPAFPAGWTVAAVQNGINFVTSTNFADSAPNAAFAADPTTVGGGTNLTSPFMPITAQAAIVEFRNKFSSEAGWDGGVLEISIGGGPFQDVITAGGAFIQNGYNGVLGANGANNPLAGRNAWSGDSGGFITTSLRLPAAATGQNIQLRWRFGADDNTVGPGANPGWYVDNIKVAGSYSCTTGISVRSRADFDGDGKTDVSVFRPSEGNWYLNQSTAGFGVVHWGASTDVLTPGDYDGDGKTDFAIFRANPDSSQPDFYILNSLGFTVTGVSWGVAGDKPVIADYDGDAKADVAVYRDADHTFYILNSGGGATFKVYGISGDVPVAGDFIGDNKADITLYRPSTNTWWIFNGSGDTVVPFGAAGDVLVPADFGGNDKDDIAVFRPATGQWMYLPSGGGAAVFVNWGAVGDIPAPGDYDGDGKDDPAIYRNGQWWILRSTAGAITVNFGVATDKAIPRAYLP